MAKRTQNNVDFQINRNGNSARVQIPTEDTPINSDDLLIESQLPSLNVNGSVESNDIVFDINQEVFRRIQNESKKPLQPNPIDEIKTIDKSIDDIIKPIVKIVDTPNIIKNNKEISEIDKVNMNTLSTIIAQSNSQIIQRPTIIDINPLSEADRRRLAIEEATRRKLEEERRRDIESSVIDESERRTLFENEIEIMKFEFQQYLKNKYPEFDKDNISNRDVVSNPPSTEELREQQRKKQEQIESVLNQKQQQKVKKNKLQSKKIERLEREKERKVQENQFQINKLRRDEIQTFLEEDVIIEQKEKLARNPEIEGLNDVQIKLKEIEQYERRLGRPIIPYRDIVESDESDLDPNAYTTSNDDLIIIPSNINVAADLDKLNKLRELRAELER